MFVDFVLAGCRLLVFVGVSHERACAELKAEADVGGALVWFKLLFAPALAILMALLFLIEERVGASQPQARDADLSKAAVAPSSSRKSIKDDAEPSTAPMRLSFLDSTGVRSRFKVVPHTALRDVLQFYCQRNDVSADAIVLRHKGATLQLDKTPEELGLHDLDVVDVETNYRQVHEDFRKETEASQALLTKRMEALQQARHEADIKLARLESELKSEVAARSESEAALLALQKSKQDADGSVNKLRQELASMRDAHSKAVSKATELDRQLTTVSTGGNAELSDLRRQIKQLQQQLSERDARISGDQSHAQQLAAQVGSLTQQLKEQTKLAEALQARVDALQVELAAAKESVELATVSVAEAKQETVTWMMKADKLEQNAAHVAEELVQWKDKAMTAQAHENSVNELTQQMASLSEKFKQQENDLEELQRLKTKHAKTVEKNTKEVNHWRSRAIAFEKEVKELRQFKRQALELLGSNVPPMSFQPMFTIPQQQQPPQQPQQPHGSSPATAHQRSLPLPPALATHSYSPTPLVQPVAQPSQLPSGNMGTVRMPRSSHDLVPPQFHQHPPQLLRPEAADGMPLPHPAASAGRRNSNSSLHSLHFRSMSAYGQQSPGDAHSPYAFDMSPRTDVRASPTVALRGVHSPSPMSQQGSSPLPAGAAAPARPIAPPLLTGAALAMQQDRSGSPMSTMVPPSPSHLDDLVLGRAPSSFNTTFIDSLLQDEDDLPLRYQDQLPMSTSSPDASSGAASGPASGSHSGHASGASSANISPSTAGANEPPPPPSISLYHGSGFVSFKNATS